MAKRFFIFVLAGLATLTIVGNVLQGQSGSKVPLKRTSATSGKEMYETYCTQCHGRDGTGTGPAAAGLMSRPTDLTRLAKKNGGKYPAERVANVLRSGSHGSQDMPVWGPVFRSMNKANPSGEEEKRIATMVEFIRISQVK
ncbi:MAG TPA: cytochrome c [Acidisarcina sp.]|nr:cytochrome c [Acidisarcina sp.]